MIRATDITKSFGAQVLFANANFTVAPGERVGLIGRNGSGKTTIFRLLAGEEHLDQGQIIVPKNYRIGYVSQHLAFSRSTVLAEACAGLPHSAASENSHLAEAALQGLGFSREDFSRHPGELAGGFQVRLHLARVLVADVQMLLLDEPTNYLDIVALRWLRRFLCAWPHELILVTHDRDFMDSVTTHSMLIHRTKVRKMAGPSGKLWEQVLSEEAVVEQTRVNLEKKREQAEEFVARFRAKASKAKAVQSRLRALEKMEVPEELQHIADLHFSFNPAPFAGRVLIEADNLSFAYAPGESPLFSDLSFSVKYGDRVAVIGRNGRGKTTLLRLLAEELAPTGGRLTFGANMKRAYFGQTNIDRLNAENSIEEEVQSASPQSSLNAVRNVCGAMMFEGEQALKKVAVISGGERSRVLLAKTLLSPANLLLLDEPANHLDLPSTEALLAAIDDFPGAVIMVTHSEMTLRHFAGRLIVFDRAAAVLYEGGYDDFLRRGGWSGEEEPREQAAPSSGERREQRRVRAEMVARRSRELRPLERRIAEIETRIIELEELIKEEDAQIVQAAQSKAGSEVGELMRLRAAQQEEIEMLFSELEEKSAGLSEAQRRFADEFSALDH